MKLRTIIISSISVLSLGFASASFAGLKGDNSYYPPERIHCSVDHSVLNCEGFNHRYLIEDTYTADFNGKEQAFAFSSGVAYFTPDRSEATVFYTYHNSSSKVVKIKSANTHIRPDFENGSWVQVHDDVYVCKAGYMNCPITSLPSSKK
ncbi:MAG TPA: hypothetical protein VL360_07055 [Gammaproteobacteria bacterium]|jgi:hypothetical protein|nr:hypothetical protein [Gammaproteobacteria bacterium]